MNNYRLTAMLLAPSESGYRDVETITTYNSIDDAIEKGDRDTAIALLLEFSVDSDNISRFDCEDDYFLDSDLDGVYLYKRVVMMDFEIEDLLFN
jgi:hypothetical protein